MDIYGNKLVNTIETKPLCAFSSDLSNQFLCRLRSIAAHRDHFVRRLSVCACVCLSDSHTFLIVTHSYVSQATHVFLGMLPLCLEYFKEHADNDHMAQLIRGQAAIVVFRPARKTQTW